AHGATVRGVLSANAAAPRRHLYGSAPERLIGVAVVCAHRASGHGGGKGVKNVAGDDLPKLLVGGWGSRGVRVGATVTPPPQRDGRCGPWRPAGRARSRRR